ncbi:hypothetical protein [Hoeflea olei]|uniref:hypothetical protein n=1 Tax=Hoeflea olei TaxID=1480615 RepID=UPI001495A817|nr:hypothetical protein [Hoeflea olei]
MTEKSIKKHFGDKIAARMAREVNPPPPDETPERRRSMWDFHRELEQRVRDGEAGD